MLGHLSLQAGFLDRGSFHQVLDGEAWGDENYK